MDHLQASRRFWISLIALEQYISHGLQQQVSSSKSFGGDDMKPIFAAYEVFQEAEPFLPRNLVETIQVLLQVAKDELNCYLDERRKALATQKNEHDSVKQMVRAQKERALFVYRRELKIVKGKLPKSVEAALGPAVHNYGQVIGAIGKGGVCI